MQLYDESLNKPKQSNTLMTIILIFIVLLVLGIIGILVFMTTITDDSLKIYIDGQIASLPEDVLIIDSTTGKTYIDIKGIAPYLGYNAHNGEYKVYSEDTNKCYVDNANETASFFLNSNRISKVVPLETEDYEDYTIEDTIISRNGKLYSSPEGIQIGFDVTYEYNKANNTISIFTLPYLVEYYQPILESYGYKGVSKEFVNQKAILYDMFVVTKDNKTYGVINAKNEEIISSKYQKMQFNENLQEFYVTSTTNKVGIITSKAETKINLLYDSISMLNKETGLYIVKNNNKYGVLNNNGDTVIYLEYDSIGINPTNFPADTIKNKYLLFDNAIPVCQNEKWGLFNKNGKLILPVEYDMIGYIGKKSDRALNSLLVIPNYKAIVLGKEVEQNKEKVELYTIVDYEGKIIVPCALSSAYSVTSGGTNTYYMEYNGQTINIIDYIDLHYETIYGKPKPTLDESTNLDKELQSGVINNNVNTNNNNTNNTNTNNTFNSTTNRSNNTNTLTSESALTGDNFINVENNLQ